ncbi:carboxypeptidase-like regulatory domain-containing protein [uncultured Draconibacterium sp.]|uniref:carboxypeptidase-like regulatory domain-containing protein n=1 Tax=uncultured Draconibacterium sp. TaxID=1573823 RepID=UPI0032162321
MSQQKTAFYLALAALIIVIMVVVTLGYLIYREGALDAILGTRATTATATGVAGAETTLTNTLIPTLTPQPTQNGLVATATLVPTLTPYVVPTQVSTLAPLPTNTPTPDPLEGYYVVEYNGCIEHGSSQGTVKGQVFDRENNVVAGASVYITIDDWYYDVPATTNAQGWYEFYVENNTDIQIAKLVIGGEEMPLTGNENQVFHAQAGCYENVNLRQQ